jgi:TusA-related sulfurtransferase
MKIDTSGLSCPEPVLQTKKAIKSSPDKIEVIVDNETALQNVNRFLTNSNYTVNHDGFTIKATK